MINKIETRPMKTFTLNSSEPGSGSRNCSRKDCGSPFSWGESMRNFCIEKRPVADTVNRIPSCSFILYPSKLFFSETMLPRPITGTSSPLVSPMVSNPYRATSPRTVISSYTTSIIPSRGLNSNVIAPGAGVRSTSSVHVPSEARTAIDASFPEPSIQAAKNIVSSPIGNVPS